MTKLFICTQTVDTDDSDLGFFVHWIEEFAKHCEKVTVVCLHEKKQTWPSNVEILVLGKTRVARALGLLRLCISRHSEYDAVFVHMNPEYIVIAGLLWRMMNKKIVLWYTHKSVNLKLRTAVLFADIVFSASRESFRLKTKKLHVMGHGIDTDFFSPDVNIARGDWILSVGRLMKSKRHDLAIRAAHKEGRELRIAGEGPERIALEALARELHAPVRFLGGLTQVQLRDEYRRAAYLIHTSETGSLDKVVLEALACGLPVRTNDPSLKALENVSPSFVRERHGLERLITALCTALQTPRIAFLFTNVNDDTLANIREGKDADTALHGFNHVSTAEYYTLSPTSLATLRSVPRLLRYDFVLSQDHLLLGYVVSVCARLFHLRTRWLYFAMTSSTLLKRHAAHPIRTFLLKTFWSSYAHIICITSEQIDDFTRLGIPTSRLTFVPFPIDGDFFQPTDPAREEDLVVSSGRDAGRDYATLFRAAKQIPHPIVVAAAPRNMPHDVLASENVLVRFDCRVADVRELYARARLVAVVSKDVIVPDGSDCSGQTVVLEALAAGKAVIATHRPWIIDYLVPSEDLIVVPPSDPEALAQAIDSLSRDVEKRKRLAASGHDKVVARYTTKAFADSLLALIDSII